MRKKNYKGRCEKRTLPKCVGVCRTYDELQARCAEIISGNPEVRQFRCNVPLDGDCEGYVTDFVAEKLDGGTMVRECVYRNLLSKPRTISLLDASQRYWYGKGICDWKIVVGNKEDKL